MRIVFILVAANSYTLRNTSIRATQCLISFQRTSSVNDRFLHLLNTLKYCSSLLVISVGAYPQIMGGEAALHTKSSFFLLCAVFNSMYSFLWDVIMDWGLGQPNLPKRVTLLRHQLHFKPHKLYYGVIVVDFGLRILWVTKWWGWTHYGVDFKLISQVAEVLRRVIWNCLRVEWQCIKLDILGTKKLSEDSMELEQSLENMPLMDDSDDDDSGNAHDHGERIAHAHSSDNDDDNADADAPHDATARDAEAQDELIASKDALTTAHHRKGTSPSFEIDDDAIGLLASEQVYARV